MKLQANEPASRSLPRCAENYFPLVEVIRGKPCQQDCCFEQSVSADIYVGRASELRIFGGNPNFDEINVMPKVSDLETCVHSISLASRPAACKTAFSVNSDR